MADSNTLPDLSDEQIDILNTICKNASSSSGTPFKALCVQYEAEFQRRELSTSRDNSVFRWILQLGETARKRGAFEGPTRFAPILRDVLQAHGITIVDDSADEASDPELKPSPARLDELQTRAIAHDRRVLQKQSWDALRSEFVARTLEKKQIAVLDVVFQRHQLKRRRSILYQAYGQWVTRARDQRHATAVAREQMTMRRYFTRWRKVTIDNATKARSVLFRKVFGKWRTRTTICRHLEEQADEFRRDQDARLLKTQLLIWSEQTQHNRAALAEASAGLAAFRRRQRLGSSMQALNLAMRKQEDAERTAIELANTRVLPSTLNILKEHAEKVTRFNRMAADFRFYYLTTRSLKTWSERTKGHRHQRELDAWAQIRRRVKIRQATSALKCLRDKIAHIQNMRSGAEQRVQARLLKIGTDGFNVWRNQTLNIIDLNTQACNIRDRRLLTTCMSTLVNQQNEISTNEQHATAFKQETDLTFANDAWKKLQWATFTAQRQSETAGALKARNNTQHMKQMLRHWASEATIRKAKRIAEAAKPIDEELAEPESPSLRPASRLTAKASQAPVTPAYLQTPGRSRRTVRFRGLLPTPAPITPFILRGLEKDV